MGGKLISLSEQELVSCSRANHGCRGGWPSRAFAWINQNGGIDTEQDYPYTAQNGYCNQNKQQRKISVTHKYVNIQSYSDQQLVAALQRGPVSVLVDAQDRNFQHYRGGVMTQSCGTQLDHAVLAVGYDSQSYYVRTVGVLGGERRAIFAWVVALAIMAMENVAFLCNLPSLLHVRLLVLVQDLAQAQPHLQNLTPTHPQVARTGK